MMGLSQKNIDMAVQVAGALSGKSNVPGAKPSGTNAPPDKDTPSPKRKTDPASWTIS